MKKVKSKNILAKIAKIIVQLDEIIWRQVNIILQHSLFQKLESSWRSLFFLVSYSYADSREIKIKMLPLSELELMRDLNRALEYEQSQIYNKLYTNEFEQPGGEPFGLLLGDYYFSPNQEKEYGISMFETLLQIGRISEAGFVPFITSVTADFLGLESFFQISSHFKIELFHQQKHYREFFKLKKQDSSCFLGLVIPQFLIRKPHQHSNKPLWANGVYLLAVRAIEEFGKTGWFGQLPGFKELGSNLLLPQKTYFKELPGFLIEKISINCLLSDKMEKIFFNEGLIVISQASQTMEVGIRYYPSLHYIKKNDNFKKSSSFLFMLHYILCISRFAHYIKVISRDKIGSFSSIENYQQFINSWLNQYTANREDLSDYQKVKYPLREAKVIIDKSLPFLGKLICEIYLVPHYQFEENSTKFKFKTDLEIQPIFL